MTTENKKNFLINIAFALVLITGGYLILRFAASYLFPFFIGVALAALIQKPAELLSEKMKIKSGVLAALMVLILFVFLVLAAAFATVKIYDFFGETLKNFKDFLPRVSAVFSKLTEKISTFFDGFQNDMLTGEKATEFLGTFFENSFAQITDFLSSYAARVATRLPSLIFTLTVTVAASCYIAKDYKKIKDYVKSIIPEKITKRYVEIRDVAFDGFFKMAKGYFLMFLITFALLSVGFLILRRKNWLVLAVITAIVDVLPVLGTGTVLIPFAVLELIFGKVFLGVGLLVLYLVITVIRHIFEPKIIGRQTGLHPLACLVAMFVGLRSMGLLGLLVFPFGFATILKLLRSGKIKI